MKNLLKKFLDKIKKEKGLVIIEATIVFPVMFFVLFFIIYIGNAYFQIAQVDDCVSRAAIKGAQCIANPQQYETVDEGMIPLKVNNAEPYRYIIGELPGGSINEIERKIENDLIKEINESTLSFFIKMNPKVTGSTDKIAEFNNYFLYSTFKVGVQYEVRFPIRFFGAAEPTILRLQSHAEVAVSDTPEFVRNVDMVADMLYDTDLGNNIANTFTKVNNFIKTFAGEGSDDSRTGGTDVGDSDNNKNEEKNTDTAKDESEKEQSGIDLADGGISDVSGIIPGGLAGGDIPDTQDNNPVVDEKPEDIDTKNDPKDKISQEDRAKLDKWKYKPDAEVYLEHKAIFDDKSYYNQETGEIIYPGTNGDPNTNGFKDGQSDPDVLKKGNVYTRYGDNDDAQYFSAEDVPYEQRALPPGADKKPLVIITVLKDIPCSSGEIAQWFGQPGGGKQYYTDVEIKDSDGNLVEANLKNLEKYSYIEVKIIK